MKQWWVAGALLFGACADPAHERRPVWLVGEAASAIAAGHGYVYFTTGTAVKRVPAQGGDAETLESAQDGAAAIALGDRFMYWVTTATQGNARVWRAPLSGGTPSTVAMGLHFPNAIAVDESSVYWIESCCSNQALWKAPKDGGAPAKLADIPARTFSFGLAIDRDTIYWTQDAFGQGDGAILRLPKSGGTPEVAVAEQQGVGGVAVDDSNLYWYVSKANAAATSAVRRRTKAGGETVDLVADEAQALLADGRFVYWVALDAPPPDGGTGHTQGRLRRMGNAGTQAATMVTGNPMNTIAFDSARIYYSDPCERAIYAIDR